MATDLSITGQKKVKTVMKEFNEKFPYLSIKFYPIEMKKNIQEGKPITQVDADKSIAEVRTKKSSGDISINGRKLVGNIENEFEDQFGLLAQVCITSQDGKTYYTGKEYDSLSLSSLNKKMEELGYVKDKW